MGHFRRRHPASLITADGCQHGKTPAHLTLLADSDTQLPLRPSQVATWPHSGTGTENGTRDGTAGGRPLPAKLLQVESLPQQRMSRDVLTPCPPRSSQPLGGTKHTAHSGVPAT